MASVYLTFSQGGGSEVMGRPVRYGAGRTEKVTSSASAASGALTAVAGESCVIFCATAVIASPNATATQSVGYYVPAGLPFEIFMTAGQSISVIDAL